MHPDLAAQRGPFAGTAGHLDAPYAETPEAVAEAMLDLAAIRPGERLLDLGSGDGRIVIAAARRGAKACGVDIDPVRIAEAEENARSAGLAEHARFRCEDLFTALLGQADVITLYLLGHVNAWLGPRLFAEAKPGARIVSHAFPMPERNPVATHLIGFVPVYLWTV